jgi:hypothetical protein
MLDKADKIRRIQMKWKQWASKEVCRVEVEHHNQEINRIMGLKIIKIWEDKNIFKKKL